MEADLYWSTISCVDRSEIGQHRPVRYRATLDLATHRRGCHRLGIANPEATPGSESRSDSIPASGLHASVKTRRYHAENRCRPRYTNRTFRLRADGEARLTEPTRACRVLFPASHRCRAYPVRHRIACRSQIVIRVLARTKIGSHDRSVWVGRGKS